MDLRGHWSSACPALLRDPRRNQVAPGFVDGAGRHFIKRRRVEERSWQIQRSAGGAELPPAELPAPLLASAPASAVPPCGLESSAATAGCDCRCTPSSRSVWSSSIPLAGSGCD